ncbi:hypothetical protein HYT18_04010 [Candidatus Microgenomates bacterium]|nr:hypothetical protein [Candidatus Microgenomates bacterium]
MSRRLSIKTFILSQLLILLLGLIFIFGLNYYLNVNGLEKSYSLSKGPVTSPPKSLRLDLEQPDRDMLSFDSSIIVSGKTAPSTEVLISTLSQDLVIKSSPDGNFSTVIKLDQGLNIITAVVFDITGDSRSDERTVFYSKEKL